MAEAAQGRRIAVLMDEFDLVESAIERGGISPGAAAALRSALEHRPEFVFVLARADWPEYSPCAAVRTLCNMAARRRLGPLTAEATRRLIEAPVAGRIDYPSEIVEQILDLTGGFPFLVQALCHETVGLLNEWQSTEVDEDVLERATLRCVAVRLGDHAHDLFGGVASHFQRLLLAYVAEQLPTSGWLPRFQVEEMLKQHSISWEADLGPAIRDLRYRGLLRTDRDELADCQMDIGFGLLRRWLRSHTDVAALRHQVRFDA